MGNPASPVPANLVMNYILKKIEGMLPFPVPFLKVYVDNVVTAIPKHGMDQTLKTFVGKIKMMPWRQLCL
ncbi:hypothetical protein M0804_013774 [Polistes exclamans]|nr:hypothetical protein M0804_013774 [Polistes exclamans]